MQKKTVKMALKSLNGLESLTTSKSLRSLEVETSPVGRYSSQLLVELKIEKIVVS